MHLNVIRREPKRSLVFALCLPELRLLAVCFGSRQMDWRNIFFRRSGCEIGLSQRRLGSSRLQIRKRKAEMRIAAARSQLPGGFAILARFAGLPPLCGNV